MWLPSVDAVHAGHLYDFLHSPVRQLLCEGVYWEGTFTLLSSAVRVAVQFDLHMLWPLLPCITNASFQWMLFYFQGKRAFYGDDSRLRNGYRNCTNGVSGVSNGESKKIQWKTETLAKKGHDQIKQRMKVDIKWAKVKRMKQDYHITRSKPLNTFTVIYKEGCFHIVYYFWCCDVRFQLLLTEQRFLDFYSENWAGKVNCAKPCHWSMQDTEQRTLHLLVMHRSYPTISLNRSLFH